MGPVTQNALKSDKHAKNDTKILDFSMMMNMSENILLIRARALKIVNVYLILCFISVL